MKRNLALFMLMLWLINIRVIAWSDGRETELEKTLKGTQELVLEDNVQDSTSVESLTNEKQQFGYDDYENMSLGRYLQGRESGVYIRNWTGTPYMESLIAIRSSLSQDINAQPLIVVNGMRMSSGQSLVGYDWLNAIKLVDIESIKIYKDAIDLARFGSEGQNGVIEIVTKKYGTKEIRANVSSGFNFVPKLRQVISGTAERQRIKSLYDKSFELYQDEYTIGNYRNLYPGFVRDSLNSFYNGVATDWQKEDYDIGNESNISLSLQTQASEKRYFRVGITGKSNQGVKRTKFNQIGVDANIGYQVLPKFFFDVHVMETYSGISNTDKLYLPAAAYQPLFNDDRFSQGAFVDNKYYTDDNSANSLLLSSRFVWEFDESLKLITMFGLDYKTAAKDNFLPSTISNGIIFAQTVSEKNQRFNNETYLTYNPNENGLGLSGKAGFGYYRKEYSKSGANALNHAFSGAVNYVRTIGSSNFPNRSGIDAYSYRSNREILAGFVNVKYNVDNKYIFDLYTRIEDNSSLENNSLLAFPGLAATWNFNQGNNGLLKISAGRSAMENADYYAFLGQVHTIGRYLGVNSSSFPGDGARITALYSPNLKMPTTDQVDLSLRTDLLDWAHLGISTFYKSTGDYLYKEFTPNTASVAYEYKNGMKINTYGVDFDLNIDILKQNDMIWTAWLNASHVKAEVAELPSNYVSSSLAMYQKGSSPNAILAYRSKAAGTIDFTDVNSDNILNGVDAEEIADPTPTLFGGFGSTFAYKKFAVDVNFSYALGGDVVQESTTERYANPNYQIAPASNSGSYFSNYNNRAVYLQSYADRAHFAENTNVTNHYFIHQYNTDGNYYSDAIQGVSSVEDASYLRLSALKVDYNLKENFKIYVIGTNLFTIFDDKAGLSPEESMFGVNNFDLVHTGSPLYKSILLGISFTL